MISGRDRISELPDAIICEILSNLPTKDAVATTILSKRWKDQWTYCFNLDFRDSKFLRFHIIFLFNDDDDATEVFYVNVKDVIALNKSPCIKKFRLESRMMDHSDITACLDSIVRRNVEEIELDVSSFLMPQSIFTCQTLVSLKIGSNAMCDIDMPPSVHLPNLKVFHAALDDPSDAVTTKLFCNLPVLEDLSLSLCFDDYKKMTLNIFTPSLKRLKLKLAVVYDFQIVVRAPSLKELDVYVDMIANYVFEELPLDVKARLKFGMCSFFLRDEVSVRTIQLINGISGVKSLAISSCLPGIHDFSNVLFPNVTWLEVDVSTCCHFTNLPCLIDRFPNLVCLVLKLVSADLQHVPQCLLLHLKRIEVMQFCGQEYELKWIENLLKVAEVLDDVVISADIMTLEERKNLHIKLSSFCCGSNNCQFKILE